LCARALAVLGLALALAGCATLPPAEVFLHAATPRPGEAQDRTDYNQRVFEDAWSWVGRRYYDQGMNGVDWATAHDRHLGTAEQAKNDDELYAAVNALLGELNDGHTRARSASAVAERRRKEGVLVGVRTGPLPGWDDRRVILDVLPGGPAAEAGVQPGWILVSCDGRRPDDVLGLGRLASGQVVRCEFLDGEDRSRVVDLTARPVSLQPVRQASVLADGWVCLRFDVFDAKSARWLRRELKTHAGAPGVIVDLRHNPGGTWAGMAGSLEEVFGEGVPIGTTIERAGGERRHRLSPSWMNARYAGPLAVLVSDRSASAAEIFAHVIQHHQRGVIIGTKTAGVVLASVDWRLPGGGELQLSLFDYRGVDGRRLEGAGVMPDIAVEATPAERRAGHDPDLDAAIAALRAEAPEKGTAKGRE
jgi:carboxyl-terminal processing protease